MLGRLGISTDKAIECYQTLAKEVFSDRKLTTSGTGVFKATKLEMALKAIIQEATGNADEPMMDKRPDAECKTCVYYFFHTLSVSR